uniref:Uncharacterized protein n=1 Tax=Podoviridae sp. ct53O25 TaxID=2826539 RepID=A0A8S5MB69_9CAUD|nr:MAG TPA: hypothetical protein [Podoviridae sp. ct53O25]
MSNSTDGMTLDTTLLNEPAGTQVAENQALPDLSDILSSIDFNAKPMEYGKTANQGHFHVGKWGALILELIANPADEESILETYGLTKYQYENLKASPLFQQVYKETESAVLSQAASGAFHLAARRVAEQGLTVMENIIAYGDDKDKIKAFETVTRLANLDPAVQAKLKEDKVVQSGVQLVVNFAPGLEPPKAFQGSSATVIDVQPEKVDEI